MSVEKSAERGRLLGPNHRDECSGTAWSYGGSGYNRVRICACGAEDHDPEPQKPIRQWLLERLGAELTDWTLDQDQDQRATGPSEAQERAGRELEEDDSMRRGYPA